MLLMVQEEVSLERAGDRDGLSHRLQSYRTRYERLIFRRGRKKARLPSKLKVGVGLYGRRGNLGAAIRSRYCSLRHLE
jgi:hypothetical protein